MGETKYKAFYRIYRPSNFNEVVGQDHIVKTLVNLIKMNKISHGYLFSGPRGTGKTSIAKIFANAINCIHSEKPEQICQQCLKNSNNNLDIIEIDAASNNSVNDVRTIREQVEFAPTNGNYKIYIIDEVHMLSKGAFNALLMTLEEPPKHAIFILATTNPDKIPDTILSRVQRYNFKRISKKTLINQIKYVFKNENINSDNESIEMIANLANGSLRDALSIADQVNAYTNSNINLNSIIEIFGLSTIDSQVYLLNLLAKKQVSESLTYFDDLVNNGVDVSKLIISLIELLKDYLIFQKTKNINLIDSSHIDYVDKIMLKPEVVYMILDILTPLLSEIKYSDIPQQLMQLSIIKICSFEGSLIDLDKKNHTIETLVVKNDNMDKNVTNNQPLNNGNIKPNVSNKDVSDSNKVNHESRDITDEYFSDTGTNKIYFEDEKKDNVKTERTSTRTILGDFSSEKIERNFENILEDFSLSSEIDKARENSVNENEVIDNTTEVINILREHDGSDQEINESLLNQYDTSKQVLDTNEIDMTNMIDTNNKNIDRNNLIDNKTKEFNLNENINSSNINSLNSISKKLKQSEIINLFLLSKRDTFEVFKEKLKKSCSTMVEQYDSYKLLFNEVEFICSSNDFILVSSNEDWVVEDLNEKMSENNFKEFISEHFGNNVHFYAITKKEYITSKELYKELQKSNNMPEGKPLQRINNVVENDNEVINDLENKSKSLFGNLFTRKKE